MIKSLLHNATHVDRVANLTKEQFDAGYGKASRPVLITDIMDCWPAKSKWNNDYFKRNFAGISDIAVRPGNEKDKKEFSVADYFTYLEDTTDPNPYYLKNSKFHLATDMGQDYTVPAFFRSYLEVLGDSLPLAFRFSWMYIGATGTYSSLHLDIFNTSAWNAVFSGRKVWVFYPPDQAPCLYNGQVDPFNPDLTAYPAFEAAKPLVCVQHPGEVVFTPSGWWHAVYNEVGGISLTENFVNDTNYEVVRTTLQYLQREEELQVVQQCREKFHGRNEYLLF